jgi:hypothetical protein
VEGAANFNPDSAPSLELKLPCPFRVTAEAAVQEGLEIDTAVVGQKETGDVVVAEQMKFDTNGNWRVKLSDGAGWMTWRLSQGVLAMEPVQ